MSVDVKARHVERRQQAHADAGVTHLAATGVAQPLRQSLQIFGHCERRALPAAGEVAGELAPGHANELDRIANFEAQLAEAEAEGLSSDTLVSRVLETVPVP